MWFAHELTDPEEVVLRDALLEQLEAQVQKSLFHYLTPVFLKFLNDPNHGLEKNIYINQWPSLVLHSNINP